MVIDSIKDLLDDFPKILFKFYLLLQSLFFFIFSGFSSHSNPSSTMVFIKQNTNKIRRIHYLEFWQAVSHLSSVKLTSHVSANNSFLVQSHRNNSMSIHSGSEIRKVFCRVLLSNSRR